MILPLIAKLEIPDKQAIPSDQDSHNRRFWIKCDIVEEPNSSSGHGTATREDFFDTLYACQSNIDINFLDYSGNVYC